MNKRQWLMGGVATVAGLAGAGWAWWRTRPQDAHPAAVEAIWGQRWDGPTGTPVVLQDFRGGPLLLNFWATWCPPCVEELPLLNAFYREQRAKGWQVLALAVDQPSAVRRFLGGMPLDFPVAMAGLDGTEWSRRLGNANGGLPFTVVFDAQGRVAQRKLGKVTVDDLAAWQRSIPAG
jgi:thiol-disulfide isomerase/thioredoxin